MTQKEAHPKAQNPLILRASRLIEAFAKSNDERDFYLDRVEGFIVFVDLDKPEDKIELIETEVQKNKDRFCPIPKLSFYETKKIMEGFVNEKVYDIDTKEKLLDIIDSKDARENFLEFIYEHHTELEKWQQFYQERSRIRIIEWLRNHEFNFVFRADIEFNISLTEKIKEQLFESKVGKDVQTARKTLVSKAKTYYSNEALNPRPKRGRPPKQQAKQEIEQQVSADIYTTVPKNVRQFLFIPDVCGVSAATFSEKYDNESDLLEHLGNGSAEVKDELGDLNQKLASLRSLSSKWISSEDKANAKKSAPAIKTTEEAPKEEAPLKKIIKKPITPKESGVIKPPKSESEKPKKKPLRSIIKKPAEKASGKESTSTAKKTPTRKRITPKDSDKPAGKRPLRKIIPNKK